MVEYLGSRDYKLLTISILKLERVVELKRVLYDLNDYSRIG
jgi:hypothetical protein